MKETLLLILATSITGCATSIPTTSSLSEAVIISTMPNSAKTFSYAFESAITNGMIKPCQKGTREIQKGHPGYMHSEPSTFERMLADYMTMKFVSAKPGEPKMVIRLNDFWIEQYSTDSAGRQFLVAMGGGEINMMVEAHLDISFELPNGEIRKVRVSGDSGHVSGIGTGTETSRVYRGRDSIEFRLAEAISSANNKAISALNSFIDSSSLLSASRP